MKKYSLKINGNQYEVKIDDINESSTLAHVTVNGTKYDVEIQGGKAAPVKKPQIVSAPEATGLSVTPKTPIATKPAAVPAIHRLRKHDMAACHNDSHRCGIHHCCHKERLGAASSGTDRLRHDHRKHSVHRRSSDRHI